VFALFLHESMNTFYTNIGSFPTLIYTILLGVVALYWASAFLGIVSVDVLDIDLGDADLNADSGHTKADVLGGFMTRMGPTTQYIFCSQCWVIHCCDLSQVC